METLHIRVLHWPPRFNVHQVDLPLHLPRHSPACKTGVHFQRQTFPCVHVNDAQHAKFPPALCRIVHKIQRPLLVRSRHRRSHFSSSFNCNRRYPHRGFSRAASTSRSRSASSFLRLTYRWLDSATPSSSQIRRWLTRNFPHSQRTSSLRSTSSTRFFQSPPSACPCPDSDPPLASSTAGSHPPAAAAAALRRRSFPRTSPSTRTRCACSPPVPAPPPPRCAPLPSASAPQSSLLHCTSSSPYLPLSANPENHIHFCADFGVQVRRAGGNA